MGGAWFSAGGRECSRIFLILSIPDHCIGFFFTRPLLGTRVYDVQPYIRRWQALWATSGRRVLLGEVLAEPGPLSEGDPDLPALLLHERLRAHWAEHFGFKPVDVRLAQALTRRFGLKEVGTWCSGACVVAADRPLTPTASPTRHGGRLEGWVPTSWPAHCMRSWRGDGRRGT